MTKRASVHPQKAAVVQSIKDLLAKAKSVAIVDYTGLTVSQATDLRRAIKKSGGQYLVAKNTLFTIASGRTDMPLSGLSAFVFSQADEVSALKALANFIKKNQVLSFKSGLLGDRVLTASEVTELAALPEKTALIAKLLSTLNSPVSNLVYNLNWNISKLIRTLDAISKL